MPRAQASGEEHTRRATESSLLPTELRARRQRLGLSQAQLAGQLGVAANTVARWERGELRASHPRSVLRRLTRLERTPAMSSQGPLEERGRSEGLGPQAPRHNLPAELSSFVGREIEIARLSDRLGTARLLTLVGSGGVGQTRLALQVGSRVLDRYPDGAWLVDLDEQSRWG